MQDIIEQLELKRSAAKLGGGEERIAKQHASMSIGAVAVKCAVFGLNKSSAKRA